MVLPIDTESYSYQFYKNLNEDVKLKSDKMLTKRVSFMMSAPSVSMTILKAL